MLRKVQRCDISRYTLVLLLSIGIQILEIPIYQKNSHVLGPGQIVTSLEHLAQCRGVQVTTMWSRPNTRAAILTNKYFQKLYNTYQ